MVAQHLFQRIVEQVSGSMIGGRTVALVDIHTCHEVGLRILWQVLHDMDALIVLALSVDDVDGFVFADNRPLIAYLTTHLTIERCVVEYKLIECVLLLSYLTVAHDMTLIFCIIVTYKLLFTLLEFYPVRVFHGGSIAGTFLLFLHFGIESLFIYHITIFTTYQLGEVKRESVSIKHTECLHAVQHSLTVSTEFIHGTVEQLDTFVECTEE